MEASEQMAVTQPSIATELNLPNGGFLSDITIIVENRRFPLHKNILCSASPVFEKMLTGQFSEGLASEVVIKETRADTFALMTKFIYTGELNCDFVMLVPLSELAKMYDLQPLVRVCAQRLSNKISVRNVLTVIDAILSLEDKDATTKALNLCRTKMNSLIRKKQFLSITFDTFLAILKGPLRISDELQLFQTIKNWVETKGKLEDHLEEFHALVPFVDLYVIPVEALVTKLYPLRALLPDDYLLDLFIHRNFTQHPYTRPERLHPVQVPTTPKNPNINVQFSTTLKSPNIIVDGTSATHNGITGQASVLGDKPLENNKIHIWSVKVSGPSLWVAIGIINKHKSITANYEHDCKESYGCSIDSQLYNTKGRATNWQPGDVITVRVDLQNNQITIEELRRNTTKVTASLPPNQEWYPWFNMYGPNNSVKLL